jgi:hypothetical protein
MKNMDNTATIVGSESRSLPDASAAECYRDLMREFASALQKIQLLISWHSFLIHTVENIRKRNFAS